MSAYERLKSKYASSTNENVAKKTTNSESTTSSYEKLKSKYLTSDTKAPSKQYISHIANKYDDWNTRLSKLSAYNPKTWHDSSYYKNFASTASDLISEGNSLAEYFKTDEKYKDVYDSITKNLTSLNDFSSAITEASDFYGKYATYEDYSKARDDYNAYQETLKFDTEAAKSEIEALDKIIETAKSKHAASAGAPIIARKRLEQEMADFLKKNGYSSLSEAEKAKADLTLKTRNAKNIQALDSYYNTAMRDNRFAELSESGKGIKDDTVVKDYNFQEYYEGDYQTQFGDKSVNKTDSEEINPLSKTLASYLNNEEYDLYTYYLALDKANGTNEAEKLYEAMKPTLEARQSGEAAEYYDDDWLSQSGFAFKAGLEGWATDTVTFFKGLIDNFTGAEEEYIAPTVVQQTSAQLRENLADDGSWKLPDWLGGGSLSQVSYDIFNTTGRMLPSVLISRGVGTFAPDAVGKLAFGVSMGTSSAGSGYAEMINLGYSKGQALSYGVMVGAAETAMSTLLGSIGGKVGGDGLFAKLSEKALIKIDNAIARVAVTMALDAASEGVEEALQTAIEPWLKSVATGVDFEAANIDEILYSGLLGAISAFVMEGPGIVGQESLAAQTGGLIKNSEGGIEKIKKLGQGFSADSVAYKIASRVNENTPASKIGRLFQEIGATITEQNVNDISAALEATGMDAPTARRNAKSYAQYINKEVKLTPTGLAMLDSNSPLADAVRSVLIDSNTTPYQRTEEFLRLNAIANGENVPSNTPVVDKSPTKEATEALSNAFSSAPSYSPTANKILSQKGYKPIERDNNKDSVNLNDGTNAKILDVVTKDGKIKLRVETSKGVKSVNPNSVNFASENTKALIERVGGLGLDSVSAWSIIKEYKGGDPNLYFNDAYNAYTSGRMGINPSEVETFAINPDVKARLYNTGRAAGKVFSKGAQKNINNKLNNQKNAATRKGSIVFESNATPKTEIQKKSVAALEKVAKALGITFHLYESTKNGKSFSYKMPDGTLMSASGFYKQANGEIWVDLNAGNKGDGLILYTAAHELTHFIKQWSPEKYKIFADFLLEQYGEKGVSVNALIDRQIAKAERNNRTLSREAALEEVVADSCESFLTDSDALEKVAVLRERDKSLVEKIRSFIADLLHKIRSIYSSFAPDSTEGGLVRDMTDALEKLHSLWTDALTDASRSFRQLGVSEVNSLSESVSPVLSERTWTESEYVTAREEAAEKLSDALGVSKKKALAYIDNVNSIAKMIADNRTRLDYEASPFGSAFVSNTEYGGSFDFTTLCKKRRLYTGTFSEIQKRLRNTALTPDDILTIRNMMIDKGLEATCGLCYVEGSRANMGKFAKEFIRLYKRDNPNAWIPDMADVNTPDGVESMKINHPEAYEQYEYFWNHYGKLKDSDPALFASQQKPKLYEARKEYKGEILKAFKNDSAVEKKNLNGGIRMQSFSDFEIVHLIDTMQIIMDMSTVGLAGQAYTKVPEFAEAFGNTGLKINLSLIAKGVDENGNLIFDDREGMPHKTAFGLRDKYSKNVGTIIVTFTDEQLLAAMADPRIDFIIPFHRSQWKKGQYGAMGLPKGTKDYTFMQNEKLIKQTYHEYRGRMVKDKASNYMPNEYWDFSKTGKENAKAYLKMCAENNKRPKFYKLLEYDGKGAYSLKKDGSTDGYWKLLIDFKMYDNDGIGSPQNAVTPDFSMNEATQILDEYRGGHHNYPVAQEVVDEFVEKYEADDVQYSERGVAEDGKKIYESNFPKGTPKSAKSQRILDYIKNVWSKKPISLVISNGETSRTILARFDPTIDESKNTPTDASKIAGGNRHGNGSEKRVTLDLADDYYQIASEATYNYSKLETGKDLETHNDVIMWHYFVNDIYFAEYGEEELTPYTVTINVKEKASGDFVYSFNAEKESSTRQTLHAAVNTIKGANGELFIADIVPQPSDSVNTSDENLRSDRDSEGNKLSKEQQEFFKDSRVRDTDGNLLVVYHGTDADFTVFDTEKIGSNAGYAEGYGFYFTSVSHIDGSNETAADIYGADRKEGYLNIVNPLSQTHKAVSKDTYLKIGKRLGEKYSSYGYPFAFSDIYEESSSDADLYARTISKYTNLPLKAKDVITEFAKLGFDGVIVPINENDIHAVVFNSNQFKNIDNLNPTSDPDIRYQDRDPDAISDRELLANVLEASAQTDWEKKKLKEYKAKIAEKEALSRELAEIENKLGKMLKAKGKGSRPRDEIRKLQEDKMNITKKLNIYDNQLLRLESTKALADLATREKNVLKAKMNAKQKAAIKSLKDENANKLKEQRKELMEEKREAISELRSEKNKKIEEIRQEYRESKEKMSRQKRETILRGKIRSLYEDLQKALDAPTDNRYIPAELAQSMIDILGLFDFDTSVIKKDGSVNQAQVRRDEMKLRLQSLKAEYDKLGRDEEESIINEYEKDISDYFGILADEYGNLKISEIPLEELEDLYDILRSINETLKDARSLLGKSDAETVYKYADEIMAQQNAIIAKRKNHKRSAIQKLSNSLSNMSISTMRNVLRMAEFDKDSALYDLFNDLEIGVRNKNFFEMESRKLFEEITKGKNEALYEEALYEPYKGVELTDDKGKKFKVTKMQMMQVILSYEREKANKTTNHVENGGFTFADITKLGKGDLQGAVDEENSHTVTKSGKELAESFAEKLKNDEWAQKYMEVARKYFNEKARDAVNEVMLQTKHRIIAKEKNYIPFVVDSAYIVAEIKGNVDVQQTINSYGSLKELKKGSSQPLIITGLNNIIDRHISDVSSIVGLTVPVRNINKVWNSKSKEKDETVKKSVGAAWGKSGTKLISQAIADVQSPREDTQPFIYKKIRSGYIGATFLLNGSVVAKQTGSLLSATSMIRYRDPATMLANLGRTMAHFSEIAAEVDKYTASAWMRRQGMSDAEVYSLLTDARKSKITKALNKLPAGVNPAKWITAMDSAVALSLWRYCKEDVKELHPELEGEELNRATAAFYDTVIENTQSMTDVLHRPEIQKSKNIISESFGMFKTDLFQMAGALQTALDTYKAHPTKANLKALGKTSLAVTSSAIWGQLLTILFAMLRYKMKPYKDDEDELTVESFLTRASFGLASELVGYVMPLFGSDVIKFFENIAYGETQDAVDNLVISSVNNAYNALMQVAISLTEGEAPDWGQYKKLVTTSLQMFGLPANNILRTVEAITNHAKDIANGEFLSFNADDKLTKAERLYDAYVNNSADYQQLLEDYSSEESATSALKQQFRAKEKRVAQAVIASLKGDVEKRVEIAQDIVSEGVFDKDFVTSSVNAEETYLTNKVKELAKYEEEGNTKKAEEILEELVERGYDEDFIDWVKENLEDEALGSSSSVSSYYKASDLKKLVGKKDSTDTLELIENLLKEKEEYYKSQGENKVNSKNKAKTSVASSLTKYLKPLYLDAWNNKDLAEVRRIKKLMLQSRLYEDVTKTVDGWMVAARKQK